MRRVYGSGHLRAGDGVDVVELAVRDHRGDRLEVLPVELHREPLEHLRARHDDVGDADDDDDDGE